MHWVTVVNLSPEINCYGTQHCLGHVCLNDYMRVPLKRKNSYIAIEDHFELIEKTDFVHNIGLYCIYYSGQCILKAVIRLFFKKKAFRLGRIAEEAFLLVNWYDVNKLYDLVYMAALEHSFS